MAKLSPYTARRSMISIHPIMFEQLEERILEAKLMPSRMIPALDILCHIMAITNQGIAQDMSAGPYDPTEARPELAWRTPEQRIRRISEKYYLGWKVRRLGIGKWMLYNDSREAFFIEFGIHPSPRRVRRPVRKLSLIKTLKALSTTGVYHRIWANIYIGPGGKVKGSSAFVQSPLMGTFGGPLLGRRLP